MNGMLDIKQVRMVTGILKDTWYRGIKKGHFPKPCKLGRNSLWPAEEVFAIKQKIINGEFAKLNIGGGISGGTDTKQ
jgi:predicted DNA-binding transcriptional regulator AlpA